VRPKDGPSSVHSKPTWATADTLLCLREAPGHKQGANGVRPPLEPCVHGHSSRPAVVQPAAGWFGFSLGYGEDTDRLFVKPGVAAGDAVGSHDDRQPPRPNAVAWDYQLSLERTFLLPSRHPLACAQTRGGFGSRPGCSSVDTGMLELRYLVVMQLTCSRREEGGGSSASLASRRYKPRLPDAAAFGGWRFQPRNEARGT
jgi:hypothetical protein